MSPIPGSMSLRLRCFGLWGGFCGGGEKVRGGNERGEGCNTFDCEVGSVKCQPCNAQQSRVSGGGTEYHRMATFSEDSQPIDVLGMDVNDLASVG